MRRLFKLLLRLPQFRGKWRLLKWARNSLRPFHETVRGGLIMELDCFEWAQLSLAQDKVVEPQTMELIQRILKPDDTFIDVGAHVGFVSLVARQAVGKSGSVIAIEPQPYNCERLLRNWELNGYKNLSLHIAAAGTETGFVELPQQAITDKSRLSLELDMPDALELTFQVPLISIADVMKQHQLDVVKLLKIDVEGYELKVLRGLGARIRDVKNIVFEAIGGAQADRERNLAVLALLEEHGFEIRTVANELFQGDYPVLEDNLWAVQKKR